MHSEPPFSHGPERDKALTPRPTSPARSPIGQDPLTTVAAPRPSALAIGWRLGGAGGGGVAASTDGGGAISSWSRAWAGGPRPGAATGVVGEGRGRGPRAAGGGGAGKARSLPWRCGSSQPIATAHLRGLGSKQTLILGAESTWGGPRGRCVTDGSQGGESLCAGPRCAPSYQKNLE